MLIYLSMLNKSRRFLVHTPRGSNRTVLDKTILSSLCQRDYFNFKFYILTFDFLQSLTDRIKEEVEVSGHVSSVS